MTSLYKTFKTNPDLEKAGILIQYGTNSHGEAIAFRIARSGASNAAQMRLLDAKLKPYRRQIQADVMDNDVAKQIMLETFVSTVLLGWEGVEDENDQPLPFTKDNAIKLFTDLPDLFQDLQEQSGKLALFRDEVRQADAGN